MKTDYMLFANDVIVDNDDKGYVLRVRDMEEGGRPREKLIRSGPQALSAPELLAVILNTGTRKEEVMEMSRRILKEYGESGLAGQTDPKAIERDFGIPLGKACQIAAAFELGRRFFQKRLNGIITIRTVRQAFEYLKGMGDLQKEQFRGIYLDSRFRIVHDEIISVGSLTAGIVHPREVFKPALSHLAVAVIVAHNHPSGLLKPTVSDIELTERLAAAGKAFGH